MSLESDFNPPEKLIWTKVLVDDIEIKAPHGPTKSVSELTLSYFLQPGGSKGVFIQHLQSSIISEDDAPDLTMVYIRNEAVPELIAALQKYMSLQSHNPQEPQ